MSTVRNLLSSGPARELLTLAVLAVVAILILNRGSGYTIGIATAVIAYSLAAMGYNLVFGYAGQPSLGQQGFMAVGGYVFGIMLTTLGLNWVLSLIICLAACWLVAFLVAKVVMRLSSHYFAMATLAFALILEAIILRSEQLGGSAGMLLIEQLPAWFARPRSFFLFSLLVWVVIYAVYRAIASGHTFRVLTSIQDDPVSAGASGVNVGKYKTWVFCVAAVMAGLAGFMITGSQGVASPDLVSLRTAILLLTVVVVGGAGTLLGPILGSIVIVVLPNLLANFQSYELLAYGLAFLATLLFVPRGLGGLLEAGTSRGRRLKGLPTAVQKALAPVGATKASSGGGDE